jgi:glycosyltransferase involved in cell wall biosynthesis
MKFSIIIPVYNGGEIIIRALTSVLEQTFKDYDVIVVNDGSTDNTGIIVESFIQKNVGKVSITLITTENFGRSAARNIGILNSKGNYICFLDADDYFLTNHLASFAAVIEAYPRHCCFFADSQIKRNDTNWNAYQGYLQRFMAKGDFWKVQGNYVLFTSAFTEYLIDGSLIPMCSTAIRRTVILDCGMFNNDFSSAEDFEFWIRLSLIKKFIAINEKLSVVVHHKNNTSHPANKAENLIKQLKVTTHIIQQQPKLSPNEISLLKIKKAKLFNDALYFVSKKSTSKTLVLICQNLQLCQASFLDVAKAVCRSLLLKIKG